VAYPETHRYPGQLHRSEAEPESGALAKVAVLLLGLLVGVLAVAAVLLWASARDARSDARAAAGKAAGATAIANPHDAMAGMPGMAATSSATASFAGAAPANAKALAAAHKPFPAALPAAPTGPVAKVHLGVKDVVQQIAPGIKYRAWTFAGGAPGPVIHVRQGQLVKVTVTNDGTMAHSVDFHAARIAPNMAFRDVAPGESFTFSFRATDPGVFMYHCGTKPVLAHIANGMYGAIVVTPTRPLPKADREYVLVSSEWYLNSPGLGQPASLDMAKAHAMTPDWVTWNGYAGQYVAHPLQANPGETIRFWVVAAGPSLDTEFHVVGTLLNRAWANGDMTHLQRDVQTVAVPAGGGGVFDVKIDRPGLYPFVSHSFASVDLGQVGVLRVGDVHGTMSH